MAVVTRPSENRIPSGFVGNVPEGVERSKGLDHDVMDNLSLQSNLSKEFVQNYLNQIKQYEGTEFYQSLINNPYLNYNYTPTIWDQWGDVTGLWQSNTQKIRMEYEKAANEYLAEQLQVMREQEHNSVANQVAEQRAAGLNPDLTGVSPSAGIASEGSIQSTSPAPSFSGPGSAGEVTSGFLQAIQTAMSIYSGVQGLQQGAQALFSSKLNNASSFSDLIRKAALASAAAPDSAGKPRYDISYLYDKKHPNYKYFHNEDGSPIPFHKLSSAARKFLNESFISNDINNVEVNAYDSSYFDSLPSHLRKQAFASMQKYIHSNQFAKDFYEMQFSKERDRYGYLSYGSQPGAHEFDEVIKIFGKYASELEYNARNSKNIYDDETYTSLVNQGVPEAEAKRRASDAKRKVLDKKVFDDMQQEIDNLAKDFPAIGGILQIILPIVRIKLMGD